MAAAAGAGALLFGLLLVVGAWALVGRAPADEVLSGVELAGHDVGGLDRAQLEDEVRTVARRWRSATVRITTPEGDLEAGAGDLGLAVDEPASAAGVLAEGRDGSLPSRVMGWLRSLATPRAASLAVTVDAALVAEVVTEGDPTGRREPVEPTVGEVEAELAVVPGRDGAGLDVAEVAEAIVEASEEGGLPVLVEARSRPLAPRFDDDDAEGLLARALALTAAPLPVAAGGVGAELSPEAVRPWLRSRAGPEGLELTVDEERIVADLPGLLPGLGQAPVDAGLRVEGDGVVVVPSGDGTTCCGPEAPALIREALLDRPPGPVALPLTAKAPERTSEEAAALGVTRPVATFTTRHAAGESRVTNIHRIADLVRGVVIEPGASFSVNGFVGRRTRENGFVEGGVIEDGVFQTSVGGGISQFATTLFNAAFFGGLDFEAYQSHSLYISRYPFGREATLSFPEPDLEVSNPTPYGVLVWPTYDASSITVTLWSTPSVSAVQSAQSRVPVGPCTRVNTERTRTWLDGRKEVDEVHATYRPREGVDC